MLNYAVNNYKFKDMLSLKNLFPVCIYQCIYQCAELQIVLHLLTSSCRSEVNLHRLELTGNTLVDSRQWITIVTHGHSSSSFLISVTTNLVFIDELTADR
jgi:hypothetical protein